MRHVHSCTRNQHVLSSGITLWLKFEDIALKKLGDWVEK
jgi:hypothetical protein